MKEKPYPNVVHNLTPQNCNYVKLVDYDVISPGKNVTEQLPVNWVRNDGFEFFIPYVDFIAMGVFITGPLDQFDGYIVEYGYCNKVTELISKPK